MSSTFLHCQVRCFLHCMVRSFLHTLVSRFFHRKVSTFLLYPVRRFLHPCVSLWVQVRVLQPVGFPAERIALGMVQDPVQHCSGKYWIPHHLSPVNNLFVGGKDDGTGFIGVTDKCEKAVCLSAAYRCIADLINDDKLCFLDIFESESGCTLCFCRDRKSTRLNSSHGEQSRMPSSA